ncbi:DEAD DEAH box helicase, partial [Brachionus plicatilis]
MSQLCKNLLIKSLSLRNALTISKISDGKRILVAQSLNRTALTLDLKRFYISNTDTNTSFDLKYKRGENHQRDYGTNKKNFGLKKRFENPNRNGSRFEDFENAEPVQASGQQIDYSNTKDLSFRDYNIPEQLLSRIDQLGFTSPFEIQEKTLKHTLDGKDLVGKAFTGSGKTLAFAIPIVSRILTSENKSRFPKCLVLSPTRELCLQLTKAIQELSPSLKCISVLGGTGYESQIRALNGKVDIVCATPGRLRDLMNRKNFIADDIEIVCLDEADELLNPNFV